MQGGFPDDDPASRHTLMRDSVVFNEAADGRRARAEYPGRLIERVGAIKSGLGRILALTGRCFFPTLPM